MSCCGTPRAVLTERHRWRVRYLGGRPIEVTGAATGTCYRFSGANPLQLMDPRDAVSLARRSEFRMEAVVEQG
jgi:hypothetical protein